jgi:hypothetical protein
MTGYVPTTPPSCTVKEFVTVFLSKRAFLSVQVRWCAPEALKKLQKRKMRGVSGFAA